jgi:hypothetical protein
MIENSSDLYGAVVQCQHGNREDEGSIPVQDKFFSWKVECVKCMYIIKLAFNRSILKVFCKI